MKGAATNHPSGKPSLRDRVMAYIDAHPGACIQTTARVLGADWSTVEYHLRILVRDGRAQESRAGGRRLFFPAGANGGVSDPLGSGLRARILLVVERAAPVSQTEVARQFGLARSGIARHLRVLEEAGLVGRFRSGREVLFVPRWNAEDLTEWAAQDRGRVG